MLYRTLLPAGGLVVLVGGLASCGAADTTTTTTGTRDTTRTTPNGDKRLMKAVAKNVADQVGGDQVVNELGCKNMLTHPDYDEVKELVEDWGTNKDRDRVGSGTPSGTPCEASSEATSKAPTPSTTTSNTN